MGLGIMTALRKMRTRVVFGSESLKRINGEDLEALLLCHALEKGMGSPNARKSFGQEKAGRLIELLKGFQEKGAIHSYAFQESLAVLNAYVTVMNENQTDVSDIEQEVKKLNSCFDDEFSGGYQWIDEGDLKLGSRIDFESFLNSRHSMRTYSSEEVTADMLNKVISLAKRAPSACNRQPWHFHTTLSKEKNARLASFLPAQNFLDQVPYFGVVTVSKSLFNFAEVNQWYTNGGIFLAYLSLAFHSQGLGSCIFQYPLLSANKQELRNYLSLADDEEIIAFVGYGRFAPKAKCIIADRRNNSDILRLK